MKNPNEIIDYYILFPYLKTTNMLSILGITLYPSDDITGLSEKIVNDIIKLSKCFYMTDDFQIQNMIVTTIRERYDLADFGFDNNLHASYSKIMRIQELIVHHKPSAMLMVPAVLTGVP